MLSSASICLLLGFASASCFKYNDQDCRDFTLTSFPTDGIESHMVIGNETNMPPELADDFAGIWYMNGNPLPDECLSFGGVKLVGSSYLARVYEAGIFSWDDNLQGRLLYNAARTLALTYKIDKVNSTVYHVTPILFLPPYLFGKEVEIGSYYVEFDIVRTADPNLWQRPSSFFSKNVGSYKFTRIVYGNGSRTEKYSQDYLANIDNPLKISGITLGKSQLISAAA